MLSASLRGIARRTTTTTTTTTTTLKAAVSTGCWRVTNVSNHDNSASASSAAALGGFSQNPHLHHHHDLTSSSSTFASSNTRPDVFMMTTNRSFSSIPLRRPPLRRNIDEDETKFRSHAVSLQLGQYDDDDSDADDDEDGFRTKHAYNWEEETDELSQEAIEKQRQIDEQKQKWLDNAKPPLRTSIIDDQGRSVGRGSRKTASARVWIQPGFGHVVVNKQDFVDYFQRPSDREHILLPLAATNTCGKFDIKATVTGGGLTGQAGAIRHGLARALNHYNPDEYRPPLKRLGYLTRDPRKVERKKVGHLKARKKPQWVKR